jgi:hypothetical protein
MPNFSDHNTAVLKLTEAQGVEKDNRERAREAHLFVDKRDGQWEPFWWNANDGKPRYTFDMTGPIIDQIAGEMEKADFDIKVKPAGGEASKDTAEVLDGMIRNIENVSNATDVFSHAARNMVTAGIDGWRVVQRFIDDDSFDQDLIIEPINNFVDRVWFDPGAEKQDKSDAGYTYVLQAMTKDDYEAEFPKGSGQSLSEDRDGNAYYQTAESVIVGQIYFKKSVKRTLHLMTNGAVYEENEDFKRVQKELELEGITIERSRTRDGTIVISRLFDAGGWLNDEEKTVFNAIPVIPTYANYKIVENKAIYRGAVEKLIDPQRVLNYSLSREIEEGALAPRAKTWMTQKQAAGHEDTLATLNTNSDPVQFYNADGEVPPPSQTGGAQINPGLRTISEGMRSIIGQSAGLFAANMGDNPGLQSGVAIDSLQERGDTGTIKYFNSQEVAICQTARILIDAIPKVYDTRRQVRILNEDGSFDMTMLNDEIFDQESQKPVTLNDLSKGTYDVTCSAGKSFQSRQSETVAGILELATIDPTLLQMSMDIVLNNMSVPGVDKIAERARKQRFEAGLIPESQMTDEEKQQIIAAQNQPQQPDAAMVLAQAEMQKAQAELGKVQIAAQKNQIDFEKNQISIAKERAKLGLDQQAQQLDAFKAQNSAQNDQAKLLQTQQQNQFNQVMQSAQLQMDQATTQAELINIQADTLKKLREAMGIDSIVGPGNTEAYIDQAQIVQGSQRNSELS